MIPVPFTGQGISIQCTVNPGEMFVIPPADVIMCSKAINVFNSIAVTLVRAVSELGDWGVFPTELSQQQKDLSLEYEVLFYTDENEAIEEAAKFRYDLIAAQNNNSKADMYKEDMIGSKGNMIRMTALKCAQNSNDVIMRFVNYGSEEDTLSINKTDWIDNLYLSNVLEDKKHNQGKQNAQAIILDGFHYMIAKNMSDKSLTENYDEYNTLTEYSKGLKLPVSLGEKYSNFAVEVNGKSYKTDNNPMNISSFKLVLDDKSGKFIYVNDNQNKEITFGMCENLSGIFPEEGYSDEVGGKYAPDSFYKYMASASWVEDRKLNIKVHITDKYLAQLNIVIGFKGDEVGLYMFAAAENFLTDYNGYAGGYLMKN